MSNLLNALSKLNKLYEQKKNEINQDQIRKTEEQMKVEQPQQKQTEQQPQQQQQQQQQQQKRKRRMIILRKCAGDIWEDPTLADWPEGDYRLFCGNLGNEVSDEVLANSFRKYPSFARSRVIRDKRTMKTRGYGFVSFLNANDYLKAFKEMNGKYVGNRPVKLSKSSWQQRSLHKKKSDGLVGKFIKPKIRKIKRVNIS